MQTEKVVPTKKKLYFFNQIVTPETAICRYMDFDSFLQLLDGKFHVPRRQNFLDLRESGRLPSFFYFVPSTISGSNMKLPEDSVKKNQKERNRYVENLVRSRFLFTSCWMIDGGEDFLMWKSYTSKIGVCVRTTVEKLLNAIDYDKKKYIPICSPVFYDKSCTQDAFVESILKKEPYYQSENEIRFYFVPINNYTKEGLETMDNNDIENLLKEAIKTEEELYKKNHNDIIIFDITPDFIDSIVLSPFIKSQSFECFVKLLKNQNDRFYDKYTIKKSDILLKNN